MKRRILLAGLLLFALLPAGLRAGENKPVKNLIFMVPDGCSVPVVTLARWYQSYIEGGERRLAVDPYFCGLVKTHCSDSPIGDSAPTTSAFMTGQFTNTSYTGMYPTSYPERDLIAVDTARRFQPLTTLPEAMRLVQEKSIGIVVTCEFPHATPANVATHYYHRNNYPVLMKQMAHNGIDVIFAGGSGLLPKEEEEFLTSEGTVVLKDDLAGFRGFEGDKLWALFGQRALPYDLDRDTTAIPSLAEMTSKALDLLSRNENGFFLMVEGSQVDWAAHANDPMAMVTEYLAFDRAVRVAMEFAELDGETLVIVVPDHGNSGISIGNRSISYSYDILALERLMAPFRGFKTTSQGLADRIIEGGPSEVKPLFAEWMGIELTDDETDRLYRSHDFLSSPVPKGERTGKSLQSNIGEVMASRTLIGFTTNGHTGEDVFLAAYHPYGRKPGGLLSGEELNRYLQKELGLEGALDSLTSVHFVPHPELFAGCDIEVNAADAVLTVRSGKNQMTVYGNGSVIEVNGQPERLPTVTVFVEPTETFYLPRALVERIEEE